MTKKKKQRRKIYFLYKGSTFSLLPIAPNQGNEEAQMSLILYYFSIVHKISCGHSSKHLHYHKHIFVKFLLRPLYIIYVLHFRPLTHKESPVGIKKHFRWMT